jgi:transitional endoplasmic reticulum ATPase
MTPSPSPGSLKLKVAEATPKDVGRGMARLDPSDIGRLGLETGDVVALVGRRTTVAKVMPAFREHRGQSRVQIDGITRQNAGVGLDEAVEVRRAAYQPAERVTLAPRSAALRERDLKYIASKVEGLAVVTGDKLRVPLFASRTADFTVTATVPPGPVLVGKDTRLALGSAAAAEPAADDDAGAAGGGTAYEDIGGLKRELMRVREIVELPLRYPEVFERLGIDAPKGVLLYGPPGSGKTQIARAVARETKARFLHINGPEIIDRMYGASEANLRQVFEEARKKAPAVIFIDEIDAIAPKREEMSGDRQIERRVVAQLLTLMDGLDRRQKVVVLAATNLPNEIDAALRRPGRFDREISIPIPDKTGRLEILTIHSRGMPLAGDVDLDRLASLTHGFVGADLEALCREAAMICLRRVLPEIDLAAGAIPDSVLTQLEVHMADFRQALRDIEPSAIREVFVEVPEVRWEEVGGLHEVKRQLIEAVEWPLKHPDLYRRAGVAPPKGVLLAGPPGCGKTLLAKAAATQTEVNFLSIKGPALLSRYVGESERGVREIFRKARQAAPCILFFDEIDALVPSRGVCTDGGVTDRVIGQFLAEMDGIEKLSGVLILGATNRADVIDPALLRPGRFDLTLEIGPPDLEARREILAINLKGKPLAEDVPLDELAARTEGYSGADLEAVCTRAALAAIRDAVGGAKPGDAPPEGLRVTRAHLERAVEQLRARRGGVG